MGDQDDVGMGKMLPESELQLDDDVVDGRGSEVLGDVLEQVDIVVGERQIGGEQLGKDSEAPGAIQVSAALPRKPWTNTTARLRSWGLPSGASRNSFSLMRTSILPLGLGIEPPMRTSL